MTDPKELIAEVRDCDQRDLRLPVSGILSALDAYARILAASPDVREIEERFNESRANLKDLARDNDVAEFVALDNSTGLKDMGHLLALLRQKDSELLRLRERVAAADDRDNRWIRERNEARNECATLLDVVRRKDAEIERLRQDWANQRSDAQKEESARDEADIALEHANERLAEKDRLIEELRADEQAARTALQEERERHAGTRAERDGLLSERTALTEAMGLTPKPDKQRSHITLMTQARTLRMSQEKRGLFVGKVVRDLCAALPEYKQKTGTLHARWMECIADLRARLEALEAYAREVETVAAAIIETGHREKYAGVDALIARAEKLISEHGAAVGKE